MLQANIKTCYSCYIHLYSNVHTSHTAIGKLLVMNSRDLKASVVAEPLQARFLPSNTMSSVGFYGPSTATVSPFLHYPYHFVAGQYISPEMYSFHPRDKDILTVLPGYMSQCHHPALHGMSYNTDNEKPTQSYIGLIGKAILSSPQQKLVLGDIYNYILTHYPYFRNKGPGWRNSIRHNLSLNDCFVKVGRSPNGKGHFWAINPVNYDDFSRGDYKRKRASRRNGELNCTTERCSKEKHAGKDERRRDVGYYESRKMHLNIERGTSESQKRGFHIETLLSN